MSGKRRLGNGSRTLQVVRPSDPAIFYCQIHRMLVKKKQAEKAERDFFQLLKEYKEIRPGDEWKDVSTTPYLCIPS